MKKILSVGNSNFKGIIEKNQYYVDKTLFIKELIDNQEMLYCKRYIVY